MYLSNKTFNVAVSYKIDDRLCRDYWNITVYCRTRNLFNADMVADYDTISKVIEDNLASDVLNSLVEFNPTEELMAKWICEQIVPCYKVRIDTTDGRTIIYEEEEI